MTFNLKKIIFAITFNFSLFVILMIGIQNSSSQTKINFILGETVKLPISFIVGISLISGSVVGSFLNLNKKK